MIIIEYLEPSQTHKFFTYQSIARALNHKEKPLYLWNSKDKSVFDLYDEFKPELILYNNLESTRAIDKLNIKKILFDQWYKDHPLISDTLIYKNFTPDPKLECDTICISQYNDVDTFDTKFMEYMDVKTKYFRYFGIKKFGGHKDCGAIPENFHSMFLSSAKNVLCLSKQFAVNAFLCNNNILNYSLDQKEVDSFSSLKLIEPML